jgi:carboxyl-terminal processing protease
MTKRNLIWAILILAAAVILVWARKPAVQPPKEAGVQPPLRPLVETYSLINQKGYCPRDDAELIRGAVGGMAAAADEYSTYISPERVEAFRRRMEGIDRGVGLRLEQADDRIEVCRILAGSPSARAALTAGEAILTIDGRAVEGLSAAEAERLVNDGPVGSSVQLEIVSGDDQVRPVALTRQEFPVESVVGLWRGDQGRWNYLASSNPPIAYIHINEFVRRTAEEVQVALRQLDTFSGLVLDLRDNPGGQLPAAVDVADLFLKEGPIVTLEDKSGKDRPRMARSEGTYREDLRIVVLINDRTASAAEIVAGALAANRRAVLIGTRTKGKGYIQGMFRLPDGVGEMNFTTAEFLVGDGRSIQRRQGSASWGVDPDVEVKLSPLNSFRLSRLRARLEIPASPATTTASTPKRPKTKSPQAAAAPVTKQPQDLLLPLDDPLRKAVELLADPKAFDALLQQAPSASAPAKAAAR